MAGFQPSIIGRFCPSTEAKKTTLAFECFTRGLPIPGVAVSNEKYSPRWGRFTVKSDDQVATAIEILETAHGRLKDALKAGEQTSYFSGGAGIKKEEGASDDEEPRRSWPVGRRLEARQGPSGHEPVR